MHWLVPHWLQVTLLIIVGVLLVLALGNFKQ